MKLGSSKFLSALFAWTVSLALLPAWAASDFPDRPVMLVVPYTPGGPNDAIARAIAPEMSKELGQPIVIENKPGAGGNIGTAYVARADADGYTVLLPGISYVVNPYIFAKVPYAFSDFRPVSVIARGGLVLVVHPSLGVTSLSQLIALAKSKPGQIGYATGGIGTSLHLAGELFNRMANVDLLHVPYKGTGALLPDLLAGRTPVAFVSPFFVEQFIKRGELIALGVTSLKPIPAIENIAPISQLGLPGFEAYGWFSLLVPAATPTQIVDKLNAAATSALNSPSVQRKLFALGMDIVHASPKEAATYLDAETAKWEKVVKEAHIKVD
ncbi:MAG: tripartite tricarboxylate transporter substrate binding protein [Caldimonas sp.]